MTINIQFKKIHSSEAIFYDIFNKLDKLRKKYNWINRADVLFKVEKNSAGKDKICEIELGAPGSKIFAISKEGNLQKAAKRTINQLEKQLKKRKAMFQPY